MKKSRVSLKSSIPKLPFSFFYIGNGTIGGFKYEKEMVNR